MSKLFTIGGVVDKNGGVEKGVGFKASRNGEGRYSIFFNPAFEEIYGFSGTQWYPADDGKTTDNLIVTGINEVSVQVKTGDGSGDAADRSFTFVAYGKMK
ncbi:hypothetical protein [Xanthomonas citri]|uniref:Uncharacterized protein n=1 Tax=Xanthomonas campestris pv. glycines TaxID=473421 RepID=A0AAX0HXS1_XANCG|nr:hypothetical protein [Xanthomonas citri]ARV24876.1 hypothetical protein A9D66_20275 [Xanthomonas citri pv. glycines str. 12-2]OEY89262.1 hypothetical protein BIY41_19480 [Xanthomonas citri pv. glycines]OOX00332.1 hypothetical protein Xgly_19655 [Xanthomonas citri pv. glycines]QDS21881.1 hypothetical protein FPL05_21085 [Xanthomonas citri pv. glycines]QEQ75159.1 hypothetical protein C2859_21030 [Xanthomonas citri pv. glycines]